MNMDGTWLTCHLSRASNFCMGLCSIGACMMIEQKMVPFSVDGGQFAPSHPCGMRKVSHLITSRCWGLAELEPEWSMRDLIRGDPLLPGHGPDLHLLDGILGEWCPRSFQTLPWFLSQLSGSGCVRLRMRGVAGDEGVQLGSEDEGHPWDPYLLLICMQSSSSQMCRNLGPLF